MDIGGKRTGIAETDPLQLIASPKETVATEKLEAYLRKLLQEEEVEALVIGDPLNLDGGDSDNSKRVRQWSEKLKKSFPALPQHFVDERYSSKMASQAMIHAGEKKKKRQSKGELDKRSAAIILQQFLEQHA